MKTHSIAGLSVACVLVSVAACSSSSDGNSPGGSSDGGSSADGSTTPDDGSTAAKDGSTSPNDGGSSSDGGSTTDATPNNDQDANISDAGFVGDAAVVATSVDGIDTGEVPVGTQVNLNSVFVSAMDNQHKNFWVSDSLASTPYAGIFIYRGVNVQSLPQNIAVGATVSVSLGLVAKTGTLVTVAPDTGQVGSEAVTLLQAPGTAPTPAAVTAAMFVDASNGPAYYGSLVQFDGPAKVSAVQGAVATVVDNNGHTFELGAQIFFMNQVVGNCYGSFTGVATLDATNSVPQINPRTAADLTAGTGCN